MRNGSHFPCGISFKGRGASRGVITNVFLMGCLVGLFAPIKNDHLVQSPCGDYHIEWSQR